MLSYWAQGRNSSFKHREQVINFGFQKDHSGHDMDNRLGENGGWGLQSKIQMANEGNLVEMERRI